VKEWHVPKTQAEVRSFVELCNYSAKFIHHFSDLPTPLIDVFKMSKPQRIVMTPLCMEAFQTLKLRLYFVPCVVLPEVISDATFIVAVDASIMGIGFVVLLTI
jgi:hypothetical protein